MWYGFLEGFVIDRLAFMMQVVEAVDLSRATIQKVYQNLGWALAYNSIAVPVAAGVFLPAFDFALTPSLAGLFLLLHICFYASLMPEKT